MGIKTDSTPLEEPKNPDTDNIIVMASAAVEAFLPYLGDKL